MASEDVFGGELTEELNYLQDGEEGVSTQQEANEVSTLEQTECKSTVKNREHELKLLQLPLARVRNLMKLDPDLNIASTEAVFLVARATELFISSLARESYFYTAQTKKKTVQKRDVDLAISAVDSLMFLEGAMF